MQEQEYRTSCQNDFLLQSPKMDHKLKKIKLVLADVDGILTDGKLYYTDKGEATKSFHVRDGVAIKALQKNNILFGIITGRVMPATRVRMSELGVNIIHEGIEDKLACFHEILTEYDLSQEQVAYIGDDLPDLPILKIAGFSATVIDAPKALINTVDYVTQTKGGNGAFREFADLILEALCKA